SKKEEDSYSIEYLNKDEKEYLKEIGRRTWQFFKDQITEKSNILPPDNYQEDRKEKVVYRTSPTNIGLGLLAVVASYDLGFEKLEDTINLLYKMLDSVSRMQKWNGHLYNWYDLKTLNPLTPKYVSTVDSGNFVGYLYTLKQFLVDIEEKTSVNIVKNKTEKAGQNANSTEQINNNSNSTDNGLQIIKKIHLMLEIIDNLINNTNFKFLYS